MAVIQEAFDIPTGIMTKVATGEYCRIGGIVRYAAGSKKGQIVKHLKPVGLKEAEQAQGVVAQIARFVKGNKKGFFVGGLIAAFMAIGGFVFYKVRAHEPIVVVQFRTVLREYIEEIRKGNLESSTIDALMLAVEKLNQHKDFEKFKIDLSTEDLDALVGRIHDYTVSLSKNNMVVLNEKELYRTDNPIISLQNYLRTQKRIFEGVA